MSFQLLISIKIKHFLLSFTSSLSMTSWKLIYAAVAAVIYFILISLFFGFKNSFGVKDCNYFHPCVRFCQSDQKIINDSELESKFKESDLYKHNFYFDDDENFTMYREELKCKNKVTHDADNLRPVRIFD